jgi:hypothetical protein
MLPRDGVILVATGDGYIKLALRATESLKAVCPDLPVDLFADRDVESSVVDRVVQLEVPWVRSKIDGMLATRFDPALTHDPRETVADRRSGASGSRRPIPSSTAA